ncbi:MAG: hypothetical protein ACR2L6_08945 [Gemmatimonadaceae bacterium]
MTPDHARRLFGFNTWANGRVLEAARAVSAEAIDFLVFAATE